MGGVASYTHARLPRLFYHRKVYKKKRIVSMAPPTYNSLARNNPSERGARASEQMTMHQNYCQTAHWSTQQQVTLRPSPHL